MVTRYPMVALVELGAATAVRPGATGPRFCLARLFSVSMISAAQPKAPIPLRRLTIRYIIAQLGAEEPVRLVRGNQEITTN